jgi:hypothetical protein
VLYRWAADAVLMLHLAFIAFVVFGALLSLAWRWTPVIQLPAAAWGFYAELTGRICPLTILENDLRGRAGLSGYGESFIEHYLLRVIYPEGLSGAVQFALAAVVIAANGAIYAAILLRRRRQARLPAIHS